MKKNNIGELLLEKQLVSKNDLDKAQMFQDKFGGNIPSILTRLGAISENSLLQTLAEYLHIDIFDIENFSEYLPAAVKTIKNSKVPMDWWLDQEVVAWETVDEHITFIARDPFDDSVLEFIDKTFPSQQIVPLLSRNYELNKAIQQIQKQPDEAVNTDDLAQLKELAEEAPVIEFVSNLFSQAFDQAASDVHVEPAEHSLKIRFRIDGILHSRFEMPKERFPAIASRIKLISGIDIAERRLPQDGRVSVRLSGVVVDLRVSTVPGVHGESIVVRLLPKEDRGFNIQTLGLAEDHKSILENWINAPHGIILVTGPTGSGKSTTLYSALEVINDSSKKIITVEDPVEFYLDGVTQIQAHTEIGYTFSRALRAIMRQDPDVVMIGEIRDKETADIAIQASLTGHLVVSTLHTNNSISSFVRLIDMGVEPFLVATPIIGVMAQRLVRKLCTHCSTPLAILPSVISDLNESFLTKHLQGPGQWKQANGCEKCQETGYKGRIGIYEFIEVTPELQQLILKNGSEADMFRVASEQGARSFREDGLLKAFQGMTSLDEVLRVSAG